MKTVCVTGHRSKGFPWVYGDMILEHLTYLKNLRKEIAAFALSGYFHFISGGAIGVDLDFADIVLDIRKDLPIMPEIAVPCENQDLKWMVTDKKRYKKKLKKADK